MTVRLVASALVPPTAIAAGGAFLGGLAVAGVGASSAAFYLVGLVFTVGATTRGLSLLGTLGRATHAAAQESPDRPIQPPGTRPEGSSSSLLARSSDERLLEGVRQGDQASLAMLMARYQPALLSYGRALVGAEHAEDIVQETWLRVFQAVARKAGSKSIRPWLFALARSASIDFLRRRANEAPMTPRELETLPATTSEADLAEIREEWKEAVMALYQLPERQRSALAMSSLDGLTASEIAEAMDLSVPQIYLLLNRSRLALARALTSAQPTAYAAKPPTERTSVDADADQSSVPPPIESVDDFLREVLAQGTK